MVATRHALNLPLAQHAFKSLCREMATDLMEIYGHPSSWHAYYSFLQQKQTESASKLFKAQDALVIILGHFELEGNVEILSPHVDREKANFMLDPAVLMCIRTYFVTKETAEKNYRLHPPSPEDAYFDSLV